MRYPTSAGTGVHVAIGQTSVIEVPGRVYCGHLTGMYFETDKCFLQPTGIEPLRGLARFYKRHPHASVLVVGHADSRGTEQHNMALSVERADSLRAYLSDDVDAWMAWFEPGKPAAKRWGTREVQKMLSSLSDGESQFYLEPVTGRVDDKMKQAVRRFQAWSNRKRGTSLAMDGDAGPKSRRELVRAYMKLDGTTLPAGTTIQTHGCGEYHPLVVDDHDRNRRVEVFLFDGPIDPGPRACPHGGCRERKTWLDRVVEEIDLDCPPSEAVGTVTFALVDEEESPLRDVTVVVRYPDGLLHEHTTDDHGEVRISAAPGETFLLQGLAGEDRTETIADIEVETEAA